MIDPETQAATAIVFTLDIAKRQVPMKHSSISPNITPSSIDTREVFEGEFC